MSTARRRTGSWRPNPATVLLALVFAVAGLLFATSASTARGTQLRVDRTDVTALIRSENAQRDADDRRIATLRGQVDALTATAAHGDAEVARLRRQAQDVSTSAGLTPVTGRGLVITLDDAPVHAAPPAGSHPDDLVVHQQDGQGVVNALWAGGAEAMMLQDQRVISTSAVRCVGNTLILQGRLYSPPYRISAIGDVEGMRRAMQSSPTIPVYLEYRDRFGLGWDVAERDLRMPAYAGSLGLQFATVPRAPAPGGVAPSPEPALRPTVGAAVSGAAPSR